MVMAVNYERLNIIKDFLCMTIFLNLKYLIYQMVVQYGPGNEGR